MTTIEDFIKDRLQYHLDKLDDLFKENELAYLSSHCKNELQIRDRIAWKLHQEITDEYNGLYVVRREWAPKEKEKNRVDLAILEMEQDKMSVKKAIALIEFKAHSIARPERSFYCLEFKKDVRKMLDWKQGENKVPACQDADLYFVFLENGQNEKAHQYESVLGYAKYQTPNCKYCRDAQDEDYLREIQSHWQEFKKRLPEADIHVPKAIFVGEAFGYKQYVSPLLIGPLK